MRRDRREAELERRKAALHVVSAVEAEMPSPSSCSQRDEHNSKGGTRSRLSWAQELQTSCVRRIRVPSLPSIIPKPASRCILHRCTWRQALQYWSDTRIVVQGFLSLMQRAFPGRVRVMPVDRQLSCLQCRYSEYVWIRTASILDSVPLLEAVNVTHTSFSML